MQPSILDLSLPDLEQRLTSWGQPAYRARQVWQALYQRGIDDPSGATELPKPLRARLAEAYAFRTLTEADLQVSQDGRATKYKLLAADGNAVEAVLMTYDRRRTACISTQAGCAMDCAFCATGQMGFARNLTSGEILEQFLRLSRPAPLTNLVLMGMGEPFHNYPASLAAVDRLINPDGAGFGARRITISTVGILPGMRRFTEERRQVNLAVSLHAATDELRTRLVPVNRRYPLADLLAACRAYVEATRRRITFEWALIAEVNDTLDQARHLARLVAGLRCHVNLIPLNPTRGFDGAAPDPARARAFLDVLTGEGISCTLRMRRGIDIQAGCGQLAGARLRHQAA
jgi:23S rRNA (adenine2503-C2)-methyltransferase